MKNKLKFFIPIILIIIIVVCVLVYWKLNNEDDADAEVESTTENNDVEDKNGLLIKGNSSLKDGKMFVVSGEVGDIQVPGDFSEMKISDYTMDNYEDRAVVGGVFFWYRLDGDIYLVRSEDYKNWDIKQLTSREIGVALNSEIKCIRIGGNYGYIFFVQPDGLGRIIMTTTGGEYWSEMMIPFELDASCSLKFLNEYGMAVDGFLTVPTKDGSKCDLYMLDNLTYNKFEKVDVSEKYEDLADYDYYHMPSYLEENPINISFEIGKDENDNNTKTIIMNNLRSELMTEEDYNNSVQNEKNAWENMNKRYDEMVEQLDSTVFVIDFENYNVESNDVVISEEQAKEIAEKGFNEAGARISSEGVDDTAEEFFKIENVAPNNFFTAKYRESRKDYTDIVRKSYIITKVNELGNGVSVYVDVTTGLIIGGEAFGD